MKKRMTWVALVIALVMVVAQGAWASEMVEPEECKTCGCAFSGCLLNGCNCEIGTWCGEDCYFYGTVVPNTGMQGGTTTVATASGNASSAYTVTRQTAKYMILDYGVLVKVGTLPVETTLIVRQIININGISYGYASVNSQFMYVKMTDLEIGVSGPDSRTKIIGIP